MRPVGLSHVGNQEGNHWDDFSGQKTEKWMGEMQDPFLQPGPSEQAVLMPGSLSLSPSFLPSFRLSFFPSPFPFLHFW